MHNAWMFNCYISCELIVILSNNNSTLVSVKVGVPIPKGLGPCEGIRLIIWWVPMEFKKGALRICI